MTCQACDIVLIPFPFSDLSRAKKRPVLILTGPDDYGDLLVVAITSQAGHSDEVMFSDSDLIAGRFPKLSYLRSSRVFSLNQSLVIGVIGRLRPESMARMRAAVCSRLGCGNCPPYFPRWRYRDLAKPPFTAHALHKP